MGTTPALGIPYVEGSAAVTDYPVADKAQADKLEALLLGSSGAAFGWAKQLASQSIPNTTTTVLSGLTLDASSVGVTLQSGNALKVPTAGLYLVTVALGFLNNATGGRSVFINRNGTQQTRITGTAQAAQPSIVGSLVLPLAANDQITVSAYQSSGAALGTDHTNTSTWFQVARL